MGPLKFKEKGRQMLMQMWGKVHDIKNLLFMGKGISQGTKGVFQKLNLYKVKNARSLWKERKTPVTTLLTTVCLSYNAL